MARPSDGWLDLSQVLAKPGRFVPMIMPVTEPAVGFGFAGGPIFLRPRKYSYFDPFFGGSLNFQKFEEVAIAYVPFGRRWTVGIRGDADFSFRNPVFYARPYVTLRGVPAMRYQRQNMAQTEVEVRWQFWKRISAVGFGGAAVAWHGARRTGRSIFNLEAPG